MKITICGGGSLGHVCIGVLSSHVGVEVSLLTINPEAWNNRVLVTDIEGKEFNGTLQIVSSNPADVIPEADIVFLCLPGFAIEPTLSKIKPYLSESTIVGSIVSSTGFFFVAHRLLGTEARLFGFQRVPYIARTVEYGKSANLLGYKSSLNVALENIPDSAAFRSRLESLFNTPVNLLGCFYEAALTNSNPILHTGRLYSMWHDWDGTPYDHCILFYKEWDLASAQKLIDMDQEFMHLLKVLPMNASAIPSLLEYYESSDAESLAAKLRSIKAFEGIKAPMVETKQGWIPDFSTRYFTEDFPYGLKIIRDLAHEHNIETPNIDQVYDWGMNVLKS